MWKLTIEDDEQKQISLQLGTEDYSIGRDDSNAIRLTDRNISRKHAVLTRNGQGWAVKDLASYNGTYVNGERVADALHVGHGDVVQLGDYRLELFDESRLVAQQPQTQQLPPHHRPDRLVVVVGPQPGQELYLDRDHFTVGRSEEADMSVNHSSVSRFHAELFAVGNGRFEIIDKGSANGIRINGQDVKRGFIEAGDALELGDVRLRFVGAGKIFRAGFDRSQMLPAVTGLDVAIGKPGVKRPAGPSIMKMVAIGALLGVIGVGAVGAYVATRPPKPAPSTNPTSSAAAEDAGSKLLEEAKKLSEAGDLEGAHKKITEIDPGSAAHGDPALREIEGKWADKLFDDAAKLVDDPAKRLEVLWRIATTPTVDDERRKKAAQMARDIDPTIPDPMEAKLGSGPAPELPPRPLAPPKPTTSAAGRGPDGTDRKALDDPKGRIGELMGRLSTLNERELQLLIALCVQESNAACRSKAAARLKELQEQP
jgi:pSer/pThr/pTyr-binding forkhead associated (FHA) protein